MKKCKVIPALTDRIGNQVIDLSYHPNQTEFLCSSYW